MKNIEDTITDKDNTITFTWHSGKMKEGLKSFQIYGFCLDTTGKVCLVRDKGEERFTLPGGRVNPGETTGESLLREFKEEVQFIPKEVELLGSLEVLVKDKDLQTVDHHQQVRFICKIDKIPEFVPRKDGWETEERIFVSPTKLPEYLEWIAYPTGKAQYEDFLKYLDK